MKYTVCLLITLLGLNSGLLAQDVLAKFPTLNKPWSGTDYVSALGVLKDERDGGRSIPSISDEKFKPFYDRLLAFENLNPFIDDSKTLDQRIELIQQYFQAFPEFLDFYSQANMYDEAISVTRLLLEASKRSMALYELKFKNMNELDVANARLGLFEPMFSISHGSLKLLEENRGKAKDEYLVAMANWLNENLVTLYTYLSENGKGLVRERVQAIAKADPNPTIKKSMIKLDEKLLQLD